MDTLLEGETRVSWVNGALVGMALTTQKMNDDSYTGSSDVVRGNFGKESYFYADTDDLNGSGSLRGGDLDFRGVTRSIRDDADDAVAVGMLIGGDDRIVLLDPTTSNYAGSLTFVYGDADGISGNAAVIGGDDFIDVRLVDNMGGQTFLYGDVRGVAATANLFGGDDIIYGSRTLRNNIYGDSYNVSAGAGFIAGNDRIYGGAVGDIIYGDARTISAPYLDGHDSIFGGGGNDTIYGGDGNDMIAVQDGNSFVYGGDSDDFFRSQGEGSNSFVGGDGIDKLNYSRSTDGVYVDLLFSAIYGGFAQGDAISVIENVTGSNTGDDTIFGNNGANRIVTGGGDDYAQGEGGDDYLRMGSGRDEVRGGFGNNTYIGGSGYDLIAYRGSGSAVRVDLRDNTTSGCYAEGDIISQFEDVSGSAYNDVLIGNNIKNELRGDNGGDRIYGFGNADKMFGEDGNDMLYGGSGDDRINGDADDDRIDGGTGDDKVWGSGGADTFHFKRGHDIIRIQDFQDDFDRIELDGFASGTDPFNFAYQNGSKVVFSFGNGDYVVVEGATLAQLQDDVFMV